MSGIIRISGREWGGRKVAEVIAHLASEPANSSLASRPLLVIRNGSLVSAADYDDTVIALGDEITVMPFTAGG
jgi:sulfur carrier protein ThiS